MTANAFANACSAGVAFKQNNLERESDMAKFIIQPHGRLNDGCPRKKAISERKASTTSSISKKAARIRRSSPQSIHRLCSRITILAHSSVMPKDTDARVRTRAMSVVPAIGRSTRSRKLKKA